MHESLFVSMNTHGKTKMINKNVSKDKIKTKKVVLDVLSVNEKMYKMINIIHKVNRNIIKS